MNKGILFFLLFFLLFLSTSIFSQSNTLYQKTFNKQDGLELDKIDALCFDNDGFL